MKEIEKETTTIKETRILFRYSYSKYDEAVEWLKDSGFHKDMVLGNAVVMIEVPIDMDNNGEFKRWYYDYDNEKNDYYCELYKAARKKD